MRELWNLIITHMQDFVGCDGKKIETIKEMLPIEKNDKNYKVLHVEIEKRE